MPEYLSPGVYVEEIERGPRLIEGVPTSTAAFLGEAERGSTRPRLVTSFGEYQRWFGGAFGDDKFLPHAVSGFFENGGQRLYVCRLVGASEVVASAAFGDFSVRAIGAGPWGRRVWVRVLHSTTNKIDPDGGASQPIGFRLRLFYWTHDVVPFDADAEPQRLPRPSLIEDFDDLVTDEASPNFVGSRVGFIDLANGSSAGPESSALAVLVRSATAPPGAQPAIGSQALTHDGAGLGSPLVADDYVGEPIGQRAEWQGLAALELEPYREVSLVYAPAVADDVSRLIVAHCARLQFRFAAVDCPKGQESASALDPRSTLADTPFAAYYYPWITILDPQSGTPRLVPPGGHTLGVYARTDVERGVFKAPANAVLRGVLDVEYDIDHDTQGQLNPRGVNVIRRFAGRGIRVWGARTLSSDPEWKYISVRRLFIFIERSVYEGLQWVVFEPNDAPLWSRVADSIRLFLRGQWRVGALVGTTEQQAFFVRCDETTMTQDDILAGRLVCEIGIAPVRPAEFVIFRIFQNTA